MNYFTKVIKLDSKITENKNKALREGLKSKKDYIFLIEDNCKILDDSIFDKFIEVSQKTGIEALMWAYGSENQRVNFNDDPYIEYFADFSTGFVMFTRNAVEKVGFMDEEMPENTWQDLEYAKRIGDMGLSTPFGMFASPKDINTYLKITKTKDEFKNLERMEDALKYWEAKDNEDFPIEIKEKPKFVMI
jgi:GT2 family glycosyltransferase